MLVGPNASGKSTFLDVVAFFGDLLRLGPQEAVLRRARSCRELIWRQEGTAFELAVELRVPETLLTSRNGLYRFCRCEMRVGVDEQKGGVRVLTENFWLLQQPSGRDTVSERTLFPTEPAPPASLVRRKGQRTPTGWRKVVSMAEEGRAHIRSETTDWNFPLHPGPDQAALAMVPAEEERFPISMWAKQFLMEGVQGLTLNSLRMREPCHPEAPKTFQSDGSNLPILVRNLEQQHRDRWLKHLQTVLSLQSIEVAERPADRHLYLRTRWASDLTLPSWLLSEGTLRFLALTLLAYLPENQATYLIEEPENGIHPRALESVFQSLSSFYDGQVLMATHSPLLLGLASPEQILCFARTESGATDIVRGDQHPRLRGWRGETNLGLLFAAGVF